VTEEEIDVQSEKLPVIASKAKAKKGKAMKSVPARKKKIKEKEEVKEVKEKEEDEETAGKNQRVVWKDAPDEPY
jgi:hypothetical protein